MPDNPEPVPAPAASEAPKPASGDGRVALPRPPRRWLRRVARTVLVVLVLAAAALFVVTRPAVLTPLLARQLSAALGAEVSVERARWRWSGGVEVTGLTIDLYPQADAAIDTARPAGFDRLIEIERLDVGLQRVALTRGDLKLNAVEIDAPVLRIVEDAQHGGVNLRQWLFAPGEDTGEPGRPVVLPDRIAIRDGLIRVERLHPDGTLTELGAMRIDGTLQPDADGKRRELLLEQTDAPPEGQMPLRITGHYTNDPARLELEVADFDLTQPLGLITSPGLRALWTELNPKGALPTLRAAFTGDGQGGLALTQGELVLDDLSVSVPVRALGLSPEAVGDSEAVDGRDATEPYDLRMTQVKGRFVMDRGTLHLEGVSGLIEGLRYHVEGFAALEAGGEMRIVARTDTFELPETPPFILRLPAAAKKLYGEYQPRGQFRAACTVQREAGNAVAYSGSVELIDARAAFHKFPYPLEALTGVLRFDQGGLSFDNLQARGPNGGGITLRGQVTDPGPNAKADVTIDLNAVPVDEHLYAALQDEARGAVAMFLHEPSWQRLQRRGLIHDPSTNTTAINATDRPPPVPFTLENRVSGVVRIERDVAIAPKSRVVTTLETNGLAVLFKHFPYPVTLDGGRLAVQDRHIDLEAVRLVGPGGLTGTLDGTLEREAGKPFRPDLRLSAVQTPLNRFLLAALPEVAEQWLTDLAITGNIGADVRVTADDNGKIVFRIDGAVSNGSATPFDDGFVLNDLNAGFVVTPEQTQIVRASGRRDAAVVDLTATITHETETPVAAGTNDAPLVSLSATATNLAVEPAVVGLIPPDVEARQAVAALFEKFEPSGRTDAELSLVVPRGPVSSPQATASASTDAEITGVEVELTLRPDVLAVSHRGQRVKAREMSGRVLIADGQARLDELTGALDAGWARADGVVGLDGATDTALLLSGELPADAPLLSAAVPEAAVRAIAGLELKGPVRLEAARLLSRADPGERPAVEFDAAVEFLGNTAALGVVITELRGTLDTAVRVFATQRPTELRLELAAEQLRAADRLIAPLTGTLTNVEHPGWLAIERLTGRVYGGTLTAEGGVPLDGRGAYRIDASLQESALGPFLEPLKAKQAEAQKRAEQRDDAAASTTGAGNGDGSFQVPEAETTADEKTLERSLATGVLSANLVLEADLDRPDSRRGRGTLRVRNAKLFEAQSGIGALRLLNFAAPSGQPLDRAEARFLVEGNLVRFDQLEVTGPGLQIRGQGTMTYPETELDLTLFTRNLDAPRLGPLSDFIDAIKDELIAIRVTGTLAEPKPQVSSLSGVRNTADELLPVDVP